MVLHSNRNPSSSVETRLLFDSDWNERARSAPAGSWVHDLLRGPTPRRETYLSEVRALLDRFPRDKRKRRGLVSELESFLTRQHAAAVNELFWWRVMHELGWEAEPIPTGDTSTPDFVVTSPQHFVVEVTTLFPPSDRTDAGDEARAVGAVAAGIDVRSQLDADISNLAHRLVGKLLSAEKEAQIEYARGNGSALLAVVFDYTTWSGLGIDPVERVASLLQQNAAFRKLPSTIVGTVLINRAVTSDGAIQICLPWSGVIRNPDTDSATPLAILSPFRLF